MALPLSPTSNSGGGNNLPPFLQGRTSNPGLQTPDTGLPPASSQPATKPMVQPVPASLPGDTTSAKPAIEPVKPSAPQPVSPPPSTAPETGTAGQSAQPVAATANQGLAPKSSQANGLSIETSGPTDVGFRTPTGLSPAKPPTQVPPSSSGFSFKDPTTGMTIQPGTGVFATRLTFTDPASGKTYYSLGNGTQWEEVGTNAPYEGKAPDIGATPDGSGTMHTTPGGAYDQFSRWLDSASGVGNQYAARDAEAALPPAASAYAPGDNVTLSGGVITKNGIPVGVTNQFGAVVDPSTGQLSNAGGAVAAQAQNYDNAPTGDGQKLSIIGQNPDGSPIYGQPNIPINSNGVATGLAPKPNIETTAPSQVTGLPAASSSIASTPATQSTDAMTQSLEDQANQAKLGANYTQGPGATTASGAPASISNLGDVINGELQNPNPQDAPAMQQLFDYMKQQMTTQKNLDLASADSNANTRGMFYGSPLQDAENPINMEYQLGLSNYAAQLAGQGASLYQQGQQLGTQNALGFLGQGEQNYQNNFSDALNAAYLGEYGVPNENMALYSYGGLPSYNPGGVSNSTFQTLGSFFSNNPSGCKSNGTGTGAC